MIRIVERNKGINKDIIAKLAKKHNTTNEIVELLLNRGYNQKDLELYIQNDGFYTEPFNSITNVDKACNIISSYLEDDKAEIYVFADYDSDGINAGYIMTDVLNSIKEALDSKVKITVYYPNRNEGYGLGMEWCKRNFPRKSNKKKLVITVDNGITKKEEVAYLQSKGVEVIITDHHAPKKEEVPNCLVVDPWLNDLNSANAKGLCGAAVAYKVAGRLLEMYEDDSNYIMNYLPNVAIATVTDMMPATPENIGLVGYGLWLLNNGYANEGLLYYKKYANKIIKTNDFGFEIGPQLNACGRMGQIEKAAEFMFESENIDEIYGEMITLNDERKELEKEILTELFKNDFEGDFMIIAYIENLGGLGGTVASKVVEHYGRPCILLTGQGDELHGSARTYGDLDLHALFTLEVQKGNLLNFGGHKVAAGVTVERCKLNELRHSINTTLMELMVQDIEASDIQIEDVEEVIEVDKIIQLKNINKTAIKPYEDLVYFGDLKEPMFAITNLEVLDTRSSSNNKDHLCLNLVDGSIEVNKNRYGNSVGKELWAWNKMPMYERIGKPKKVNVIGKIVPDFRNPKFYTFDVVNIIPA